jgi:hypothetical protein
MEAEDEVQQLDAIYKKMLDDLEGEPRDQVVKRMEVPDKALRDVIEQYTSELEELEQVCAARPTARPHFCANNCLPSNRRN